MCAAEEPLDAVGVASRSELKVHDALVVLRQLCAEGTLTDAELDPIPTTMTVMRRSGNRAF
jgi:hypothetical protein